MNTEEQVVDLYRPMKAARPGKPPLALRVTVQLPGEYVGGGVPSTSTKSETYVLLSALPEELRQRVITAAQMITSGQ